METYRRLRKTASQEGTELALRLAPGWRSRQVHHEWGQDESEVEYLIQRLTEPGQFIVDPFCGGGTIPAACKALGRKWLATERDRSTALVARKRLAEMNGKLRRVG